MKRAVPVILFSGLLSLFFPVLGVRTDARLAQADGLAQAGDLVVHEWGTFTSIAGEDGGAVDWNAIGCKDDLPGFVNDYGYRGFKAGLRGTVRMETPVMYFYTPRELMAHVRVDFPHGLITEWYPQGRHDVYQRTGAEGAVRKLTANQNGIDMSLGTLTGTIEWQNVRIQPDAAAALPVEREPSRYYAARATDAAPVTVGDQQEKFLFYRGVGRFQVPLSVRLSGDGRFIVQNRAARPVPSVILFENRDGKVGYVHVDDVGNAATIDPPSLDGTLTDLENGLEAALVEQGLFPKEAAAMVETWHDSWFEEGARLIYVMPSQAVDTVLPLQIDPVPSEITRVFVGRIELLTPRTTQAVEEALVAGDSSTIDRYGRFLEPIMERIQAGQRLHGQGADQFQLLDRLLWGLQESTGVGICR